MENKYANTLLESIDNIKFGLKYYIERCLELENELKVYRKMYENRVNEYIKLLKENEKKDELIEKMKIEKLQKENELAKKQVEYDKTHIYTPQTIKLNYIPVQKIKGKIEDLKMSGGSDGKDNTENTARELVIEALQDILDESKEE